jgi:hypothetical protein
MARKESGRRRARDLDPPLVPDAGDDLAAAVATTPPPPEPPEPPEPEPEPAPEPPKPAPPAGPVTTLSVFARRYGNNPLMHAFQQCEKLSHRRTRKRTQAEWKAEYEAFLKEPR